MFVWKILKINEKEAGEGLFLKNPNVSLNKNTLDNSSLWLISLGVNKALWLDVPNHMASLNQSECIIFVVYNLLMSLGPVMLSIHEAFVWVCHDVKSLDASESYSALLF